MKPFPAPAELRALFQHLRSGYGKSSAGLPAGAPVQRKRRRTGPAAFSEAVGRTAEGIGALVAAFALPLLALAALVTACIVVPPLAVLHASPLVAALRWSDQPMATATSARQVFLWSLADALLLCAAAGYWTLRLLAATRAGDMRAKRFALRLLLYVPAAAGVMVSRITHVSALGGHGIETAAGMAGWIASGLLVATVIGRSASTVSILAIGVVVGLTAALPPWAAAAAAFGAIAGQYPARFLRDRRTVVRCAALVMAACGLVAGVAALLTGQTAGEAAATSLEAVLIGCLGAALWFTLLTMLERPFQLTTPLGLLELLDPTRPMLERFSREAPGTFAHSLMVGHLAASAANAIGADSLLCRVAAQYHDIGKLCRAQFFKENQQGGNVHDQLAPSLSAIIVNSHVRDGERMAKELGLPPVIQDIITQHHGTTLMRYFYSQAAGGLDPVRAGALQSQFRYPGPKPQTREAGIMMLADACEAASRTLRTPNRESIRKLVDDIADDRIADGQLDECPLTLRDLSAIRTALADVICATMHERIEYPASDAAAGGSTHLSLTSGEPAARTAVGELTPPVFDFYENFDPAVLLSLVEPPLGLGDPLAPEPVREPEAIVRSPRAAAKRVAGGSQAAGRAARRGAQPPVD